jgi:hypothetical protein
MLEMFALMEHSKKSKRFDGDRIYTYPLMFGFIEYSKIKTLSR